MSLVLNNNIIELLNAGGDAYSHLFDVEIIDPGSSPNLMRKINARTNSLSISTPSPQTYRISYGPVSINRMSFMFDKYPISISLSFRADINWEAYKWFQEVLSSQGVDINNQRISQSAPIRFFKVRIYAPKGNSFGSDQLFKLSWVKNSLETQSIFDRPTREADVFNSPVLRDFIFWEFDRCWVSSMNDFSFNRSGESALEFEVKIESIILRLDQAGPPIVDVVSDIDLVREYQMTKTVLPMGGE